MAYAVRLVQALQKQRHRNKITHRIQHQVFARHRQSDLYIRHRKDHSSAVRLSTLISKGYIPAEVVGIE